MSENLCVHCGRPCPDGYADSDCAHRAGDRLHDIADMTPAARDIATGMARHGSSGPSGTESRIPLNLGATQRLNAVGGNLAGWARHVAETRGIDPPQLPDPLAPILGPLCRTREHCRHQSCKPIRDPGRPTVHITTVVAEWLAGHTEWIRHRKECEEFLSDVELCHRVVRSLVRGPSEQKFLGPCGAEIVLVGVTIVQDGNETYHPTYPATCDGDVYAYRGAKKGRCKACGAEVATSEREAWLDGEVRQRAFTAKDIADAFPINIKTIRSWATPRPEIRDREGKKILQYARPAVLFPHGHDRDGRPMYLLGEVLNLAASAAARRATEQAKRARRAADRQAADSEDAA